MAASAVAAPAYAQSAGAELSGFVGMDYFGDNVKFGDSPAYVRDVYSGSSPMLGVRFAYLWAPGSDQQVTHFSGGFEVEGAFTPTYSENGLQADSMKSYFTPFIGYRLHGIARLGDERFGAHVLAGLGGLTVASNSPFLSATSTAQFYGGVGLDLHVGKVGMLRADFHEALMPAMKGGWTPAFEVQLGLTRVWGSHGESTPVEEEPVADAAKKPAADKDSDGDGFPDSVDKCPTEPETVNGIEDQDGCPEKDSDGDGIVDAIDKCPTQPEDRDHFQDADGCPDPDNDGDGVVDAVDVCPNEPETYNGFHDDDGCPDEVPDVIKKVLTDASNVKYERGKAKIVKASQPAIRPLVGILQGQPDMRIVITAHPDKDGDKPADLAKKRAEAIRFYLEDQGIAIVRNDIVIGPVSAKGPVIEVSLYVPPPPKPVSNAAAPSETLP
ncbi:MAG TPA: thrombospondin type 3 repeat-containing protein [Kofleriaceae bacterium]